MERFAWSVTAVVLLSCVGSCASSQLKQTAAPVKNVAFRGVPEDEELRSLALLIANEDYARVQNLLGGAPPKHKQFKIVFKELWKPKNGPVNGYTAGDVIELNPEELKEKPARLAFTLRHEMVHLFQSYAKGAPLHWREGICDYIAFKLSDDRGVSSCQCSGPSADYKAGYQCAAAFLMYLEATYAEDLVSRLHLAMKEGNYSDNWFVQQTCKELPELWAEFRRTERFTPAARDRLALDEALSAPNLSVEKSAELLRTFLKKQPGGRQIVEAGDFLKGLATKGKLPGFNGEVPAQIVLELRDFEISEDYPRLQTVRFLSKDSRDRYIYRVVKASKSTDWRLIEARRVSERTGRVVKRYTLENRETPAPQTNDKSVVTKAETPKSGTSSQAQNGAGQ